MLQIPQPTESDVVRHLVASRDLAFSFDEVGTTRTGDCPAGFALDHERTLLGHGADVFERAKSALRRWEMFPDEMATLFCPERPIEVGAIITVQFRVGPFWSLNPNRIVYTLDQPSAGDQPACFGFAYGTLPGHLECGEERFLVEWDPVDDAVWYDLLAVSKPGHVLTRLGYLFARREQARFRRLSARAMQQAAVANGVDRPSEALC